MTQPKFETRALKNDAEIETFLRIAIQAFSPDKDPEQEFAAWHQDLLKNPLMHAECVRGAFDPESGQVVGGYILWHRILRLDSLHLKTGCIGAVAVAAEQRKRGVATALMEDAIACTQPHKLPLLFLTGIPNFYHRLGYTPVLETTDIYMERKYIQALPAVEAIQIREATVEDAPALLALYQQQYHTFTGSFERSLEEQRYILSQPGSNDRYLLALNQNQQVTGYLLINQSNQDVSQQEVAATTWPALSALLQEHERRVAACQMQAPTAESQKSDAQQKTKIRWSVPEDTFLFYHLASHIPFRCERQPHYSADWMARVGDLECLVKNLLPLWQRRLTEAQITWPPALELVIDQQSFVLVQNEQELALTNSAPKIGPEQHVRLTSQAFVQLCFGYRPIAWFAAQPKQAIPDERLTLLDALFPRTPAWVAGSDFF